MHRIPFRINSNCSTSMNTVHLYRKGARTHMPIRERRNQCRCIERHFDRIRASEKCNALKMVVQTMHSDSLFSVQWQVASYFVRQYWRILFLLVFKICCYTIHCSAQNGTQTHTQRSFINRIGYQFYDFHIFSSFYFLRLLL